MSLQSVTEYIDDLKTSRRRAREYEHIDYSKLQQNEQNSSAFIDAQFILPTQKIPWKAIILASLLLLVGSLFLIFGLLIVTGHLNLQNSDRMWVMIILGVLMFVPGAYHVRIAYYAYKKIPGYSFDDIPEFE